MLIHSRVFFAIVLGILHLVVDPNGVEAKSLTVRESRQRGNLSSISKNRRRKRDLPSDEEINTIIDLHNTLRAQEGASNMKAISWKAEYAEYAQAYADNCVFQHQDPQAYTSPTVYLGENIHFLESDEVNYEEAINAWYGEKENFLYDLPGCVEGTACGAYAQVVQAKATSVGCAYSACDPLTFDSEEKTALFVVCYYSKPNKCNETPFNKGEACSECGGDPCNDGLCGGGGGGGGGGSGCDIKCKHCGVMDMKNCICDCKGGWSGRDCSEKKI